MKNKVTVKMIRKAVKILKKYEKKPDSDGLIEVEDPRECFDFLEGVKPLPRHLTIKGKVKVRGIL